METLKQMGIGSFALLLAACSRQPGNDDGGSVPEAGRDGVVTFDLRPFADDKSALRNPDKGWCIHYYDNGIGAYGVKDGAYLSPSYKETQKGTAVFIAHNNLSKEDLQTLMAACKGQSSSAAYALLPCNTSEKSLQTWMSEWDKKYPNQKKYVLGVEDGAREALALPSGTFSRSFYLNPAVGDVIQVAEGQEIFFAGTELDSNYKDMDKLYIACKKNDAAFQYRIVRGYKNKSLNIINSFKSILSYFNY